LVQRLLGTAAQVSIHHDSDGVREDQRTTLK